MMKCGDTIKQQVIKMKRMLTKMIRKKQVSAGSLDLEHLRSKIPNVAFNYQEFQEPLVALD